MNNGGCNINANCLDINGSVNCTCKPGFLGNGFSCTGMIVFFFQIPKFREIRRWIKLNRYWWMFSK